MSLACCLPGQSVAVGLAMVLGLALGPDPARAQLAGASSPVPVERSTAALSYEEAFNQLLDLKPLPDQVAEVSKLVLERDVGKFTLQSGKLYLLSPVDGRTVGAVFEGIGTFNFAPESPIEQERLARFENQKALDVPIESLVLLFADSTLAQLQAALKFAPGPVPNDLRGRIKDGLKYLAEEDSKTFEPDLMGAFLNGETNDLFFAHIKRASGGALMFMLNPNEVEAVRLQARVPGWRNYYRRSEVVCQFPRRGLGLAPRSSGERTRQADIQKYTIDASVLPTGVGELGFVAAAKLEIVADAPVGPWVAFELFEKLKVDSARWEGGEPATLFRGKESNLLWVLLDSQIRPGDVRTLNLYYRGDLIDRIIDFFQIKSSAVWYPRSLEGRSLAKFDLTFHTGEAYLIASVGERVDSSKTGRIVNTRWVSPGPIRNASFNLGLFKDYTVRESDIPPVTVMISEEAHKKLRYYGQQRNMRETVSADVTKSLRFFQSVYGPSQVGHFYATEIPGFHGEAFPGMVHLSWATFQQTDLDGESEAFRAHEVAHQWWGIGTDFVSYHDQWLSEGFATFSGLWYLQSIRKNNEQYFAMLRRWRSSIVLRQTEPGPIWLGYRVTRTKDDDVDDYQTIVYQKGAWVLHMLRILMLDLKTMSDDRFTAMMKDFYAKYEGRRASTADFRKVVEQHTGTDMAWFFDQWVFSAQLPSYKVAWKTEPAENGQFRVKLRVEQEGVPESFLTYVPVMLELGKDQTARVRVKVKGPRSAIELPMMPAKPKNLRFNDLEGVLAADVNMVGWRD